MVKLLSHKLVQLQSSRLVDVRGGRLADPEREVAFEDAERLRDALQRGEERVFSVSLYVLLRAGSQRALDDLTRRVETTLDGMLAHSRVAILEQERAFRACLPTARTSCWSTATWTPARWRPRSRSPPARCRWSAACSTASRRASQSPVIVDPFDASLENANLAVFAMAGRRQELLRQAHGAAQPARRRRLPGRRPGGRVRRGVRGGRRSVRPPGQHLAAPPEPVRPAARRRSSADEGATRSPSRSLPCSACST